MKSFKGYLAEQTELLSEATTASTQFEGVIVDCWNLKKDLIKSSNVQAFLKSAKKDLKWQ